MVHVVVALLGRTDRAERVAVAHHRHCRARSGTGFSNVITIAVGCVVTSAPSAGLDSTMAFVGARPASRRRAGPAHPPPQRRRHVRRGARQPGDQGFREASGATLATNVVSATAVATGMRRRARRPPRHRDSQHVGSTRVATPSLYRRYRPRRFAEIKGQDHVVRALRDAVAGGREGQAYLFSGPRGTGKTTSARILAKVLNCERPVDGEPCCECASCLDVERGVSYDVHELDAASNNGVEAMRDLIEKANLGTPGRHKVYILDEVHMLSKPAEATLLKTLEEPPSHVVFVLATTDPQKVSDTIRSRTQHLRFHLLPPDVLAEHVRWVADDAGLDVSDRRPRRRRHPGCRLGPRHAVGARADRQRRRRRRRAAALRRVRRGAHRARPRARAHGDGQPRQRRPRPAHDRRGVRQAPAQRLPVPDGARPRAAARHRRRRPRRAGTAPRRSALVAAIERLGDDR